MLELREYSHLTFLHFKKLKLTVEVKLEELEFSTSEILEVKKRELKTLLTQRDKVIQTTTIEKPLELRLLVVFCFYIV